MSKPRRSRHGLEVDLTKANLRIEQLRILCVTQRMLHEKIVKENGKIADQWRQFHVGLIDALAFFDRVNESKSEWTARDIRRLAELRALAGTK